MAPGVVPGGLEGRLRGGRNTGAMRAPLRALLRACRAVEIRRFAPMRTGGIFVEYDYRRELPVPTIYVRRR